MSNRIGIIGLGFMAVQHIKAYRQVERATIGALCNPSGRRLDGDFSDVAGNVGDQEPIKLDMQNVSTYQSFTEMVNDPNLDIIDICTPTATHIDLAIEALKAGKHVLCEKPLARNTSALLKLKEVAAESPGFFMPAMCLRFWPEWRWLKLKIESGEYGKVLDARFRRVAEPPPWGRQNYFDGQASGGGLFDLHIHDTDFVQYCFGLPKAVFSQGYSKHSGAIDHVITLYETASEAVISAEGSWAMTEGFGFNMAYTVNFEKATVDFDIARSEDSLRVYRPGLDAESITCEGGDGYIGEMDYFLRCIESNTPPSIVTLDDGLGSVRICEAEEKSALEKRRVELSEI